MNFIYLLILLVIFCVNCPRICEGQYPNPDTQQIIKDIVEKANKEQKFIDELMKKEETTYKKYLEKIKVERDEYKKTINVTLPIGCVNEDKRYYYWIRYCIFQIKPIKTGLKFWYFYSLDINEYLPNLEKINEIYDIYGDSYKDENDTIFKLVINKIANKHYYSCLLHNKIKNWISRNKDVKLRFYYEKGDNTDVVVPIIYIKSLYYYIEKNKTEYINFVSE